MSFPEILAKRAMEFRMSDEYIRALGNLNLSDTEIEALTALMKNVETESWDAGYDDAMIDTLAPVKI